MEAPYPAAEQQQLHGKGAIDQCIWADRVGPHQRPAQQGGRQTPGGPEEARKPQQHRQHPGPANFSGGRRKVLIESGHHVGQTAGIHAICDRIAAEPGAHGQAELLVAMG